jgi:NADH-quinone oxidoreductase subunit N
VIGVVTSVVGAYYYLRIVKLMYFDEPEGSLEPFPAELGAVLSLSGILMFAFLVIAGPLVEAAGTAARSLF